MSLHSWVTQRAEDHWHEGMARRHLKETCLVCGKSSHWPLPAMVSVNAIWENNPNTRLGKHLYTAAGRL